jgi:alcohol dehydrogenase class IV
MSIQELQPKLMTYSSIARVLFGVNAVEQVGAEAARLVAGRRCLIITEPGIVKAGLVSRVEASLNESAFSVKVCDRSEPEPRLSTYEAVLQIAQQEKPDIVVGLGGGSSLDVAKAVSRGLTSSKPLAEYVGREFDTNGIPLITVPTTSGTAAEVTPDAVVLLPDQKVKTGFFNTRAAVAIVDPTMTLSLPPRVTAATGVDALSHAIESALSKTATPLTQALALESIRLISDNLRIATFDGNNLDARTNMAWATLIEGFSESNAGDVEGHAVAHVLGGNYRVHHGQACGIALPYCMKYNLPVNIPILARIAYAMDQNLSSPPRIAAEKGIYAVHELIQEVGAPTSIAEVDGASKDDIPRLAKLYCTHPAITSMLQLFAKRGVPSEAEASRFFEEMFEPFYIPTRRTA